MKTWMPYAACFLLANLLVSNVFADEAAAVAAVEKLGGTVHVIAQNTAEKEVSFHLTGKDVTDDGLVHLQQIPQIVWLNLRGTKITDAGLKHLAHLQSLTRLHLEQTAITDAGLQHLLNLENLEYLNLYATQVTDAGIQPLQKLRKLKQLYLWRTQVTQQGAEQLQAQLPDLVINRGADAEPALPTTTLAAGRYVKVRLEGDKRILSLAEVQVLETGTGKELQIEGQASQSTVYGDAEADRAKDGNPDGVYTNQSVTHTTEETNPWWLLDLGQAKEIGKIAVHNRSDCCGDRLQDAIVEVFDPSLRVIWTGKISDVTNGSVTEFVAEAK